MPDNVTLIHDLYEAFGRGDLPCVLSYLADDVEWVCYGPASLPISGTFIGPAKASKFFTAIANTQSDQKTTVEETWAAGDQVIAIGRYSCTVTATQKHFDSRVAHIFTARNDKVTRFLDFIDTAHAVDAYTAAGARASA